jgi:hypothetical protein
MKSKAVAVFDISSSSVAGAHVLLESKGDMHSVSILVQERRDSNLEEELNIERFVNDTAKTLETVIEHVRNADLHHPSMIQVVLGSPWYSSYTRTIAYSKNTFFSVTERLVESLIEKEVAYLLRQPDGQGTLGDSFVVAEQQLSHTVLNGYETNEPYGKKVQSLELILHISLIPKIVADRFTSIIRRSYGSRKIQVTTGAYAAFVALRDHGAMASDCVLIDIGEEVTDVAFVRGNLLLSQQSFPVGTYELYRALSGITGNTIEARALVEAYRLKKLSPSSTRSVEKALQLFVGSWQQALHTTVDASNTGFQFPTQCYIVADYRFETIFTNIIAHDPFLLHAATAKEITATFIDPSHFTIPITTASTEHPDVGLAVGALFIDRLI